MPSLYDRVILRDGTYGIVCEVLEAGVAYLLEQFSEDRTHPVDVIFINQSDIAEVIGPSM